MKKAGILFAVGAVACGEPKYAEPLTPEEQVIVDDIIERAQLEQTTVNVLARKAGLAYNSKKEDCSPDELVDELNATHGDLLYYYDHGQIKAFSEAERPGDADPTAGFRGRETKEDRTNDLVLLNRDTISQWTVGTLMHESAHRVQGHGPAVQKLEKKISRAGDGADLDDEAELNRQSLASKDFAFLVGDLYDLVDYGPGDEAYFIRTTRDALKNSVANGEMSQKEAVENIAFISTREGWEQQVTEKVFERHGELLGLLGITEDEYADVIKYSELYEYSVELHTEAANELRRELMEMQREKEGDYPRPTEGRRR